MQHSSLTQPNAWVSFKRVWVTTAALTALSILSFQANGVYAQPAPGMPMGPGAGMAMHEMHRMNDMPPMHMAPMDPARQEKMWQRHLQHFDNHMAEMKKRLEITPAQEGAWSQFVSALRPSDKPEPMAMGREQWREMMQMKAPDRMEKMLALQEARHAQRSAKMHQHLEALKALYPQLNETQQKMFDKMSAHMGGRRQGWHHP
jgi:periplasmic protein CpxP/Spy